MTRSTPRGPAALLTVLLLALAPLAAAVEQIRMHASPDHLRIVFDLARPTRYEAFTLEHPNRIVLDLADSHWAATVPALSAAAAPLRALRHSRRGDGVRIVLDLDAASAFEHFVLAPVAGYGHRLVVDLQRDGAVHDELPEQAVVEVGGAAGGMTIAPRARPAREIVVAIDAGHGGEDPGAIGPGGVREKDVVLAIARTLAARFDDAPGYRALPVRTGDYYVGLDARRSRARRARADVFLSIHADAFEQANVRGASVYALSERGATSETARLLAEQENRADLIGGVGSVSLADKDEMLASVLLDLSMTHSLSSSLSLGRSVLDALGGATRLHSRRVHQAAFRVLKSPDVPSLLIECGYISNPQEARALSDPAHQRRLAGAIFRGVTTWMERQPPEGTLIAQWLAAPEREHRVALGDTLSQLASTYGVSIDSLRTANGLKNDVIKVGSRLRIPGIAAAASGGVAGVGYGDDE